MTRVAEKVGERAGVQGIPPKRCLYAVFINKRWRLIETYKVIMQKGSRSKKLVSQELIKPKPLNSLPPNFLKNSPFLASYLNEAKNHNQQLQALFFLSTAFHFRQNVNDF